MNFTVSPENYLFWKEDRSIEVMDVMKMIVGSNLGCYETLHCNGGKLTRVIALGNKYGVIVMILI